MSGILFYCLAAVGSQFLITSVLISISCLASIHLYLFLVRRRETGKEKEEVVSAALPERIYDDEQSEEENGIAAVSLTEENDVTENLPMEKDGIIYGRYEKSFSAKLIQSSDNIKKYYTEIVNKLLRYKKIRNRISWSNSSFFAGRRAVAKFAIRGKTMYLYFALNPQAFSENRCIADESDVKKYEKVPLRIKIRSERGVKLAKKLIGVMAEKYGFAETEDESRAVSVSDYPYDTVDNLLKRKLIRLKMSDGRISYDNERIVWEGIERREKVRAEQVNSLISDETAGAMVEEVTEEVYARPKGIINIDTLSQNFLANDTVTIRALKEKKLISKSVNNVKVLARGVLDKPLTVKMTDFSTDAIKMIILTGGKVIKINSVKK